MMIYGRIVPGALLLLFLFPTGTDAAACTLCESQEVTIPASHENRYLGLTDPLQIDTCSDLYAIAGFVPEDTQECKNARALASYCGCPVARDACRICGSYYDGSIKSPGENGATTTTTTTTTIQKPLFEFPNKDLNGIVDLSSIIIADTKGIAPSCDLVESFINTHDKTSQQCLNVPMDDLQSACQCTNSSSAASSTINNSNSCSMCAGGDHLFQLSDELISFKGERRQCPYFVNLAKETGPDSDECRDIQQVSWLCGCPAVPNSCGICPEGTVLENSANRITVDGGTSMCSNYEAKLRTLDLADDECNITPDIRRACQCVAAAAGVMEPCSICPGGEDVGFPDKDLTGLLDGLGGSLGLNFLGHSCGILQDTLAATMDMNSKECKSIQSLAKLCGCPARKKNACNACPDGVQNPYAESVYEFGAVDWGLETGLALDVQTSAPFSCGLVDSFLHANFEQNDWQCFNQQLTKSNLCGCESSNQGSILVWCQRIVGTLSMVGSLMIVWCILRHEKVRWSTYNQILFGISFFDLLSSSGFALATLPVPEVLGIYGAKGTAATCKAQGFIIQLGQASMYYNVALCLYFVLVIKYNWMERKFAACIKWMHALVLAVAFILAFLSIPFHVGDYRWCYIQNPPYAESRLPGILLFILPVSVSIIMITCLSISVVWYVRKTERRVERFSVKQGSAGISPLLKKTLYLSFFFVGAFYIVWPIMFASFIMRPTSSNYWFYVVAAILGPSQGIFNCLIFFQRKKRALSAMLSTIPVVSWISTMWGSSEMTISRSSFFDSSLGLSKNKATECDEGHSVGLSPPSIDEAQQWDIERI